IWLSINVFVGITTAISAYCGYIDPDKMAIAQVLNMLYPGWVLLSVLLIIADLFLYRKSAWIATAGILVGIGPILDFFPLNIKTGKLTADESGRTFTVLTYNTYGFADNQDIHPDWGNRTLSNILAVDADIVCIQEGNNITGKKHGVGSREQRDSVRTRYPYIIDTPELANEILLSKYPARLIPTPQPEWGTGKYAAYILDVEGNELLVINCHLQSIGLTPDDKEAYRELTDKELRPTRKELSQVKSDVMPKLLSAFKIRGQQARHIKQFIDSMNIKNVVLTGDFNDVAGSYAYRTIRSCGLKDAYAQSGFGPTITYNASRFYFHIDQIFYRGDLRSLSIARGRWRSSD
ncbi:MAG: endonuclease/exonuclease/phosphatase family protein, partial [Muribaculum sp.]|nr:endonuclease/exonuclease/phosphatase family protein [Muribaculum sp.]